MPDDNVIQLNNPATKRTQVVDENKAAKHEYIIIDIRWFANNLNGNDKPIACVLCEDPTMRYVFGVIGTGSDLQHIAAWGTKIDRKMAEGVFGYALNDYKKR